MHVIANEVKQSGIVIFTGLFRAIVLAMTCKKNLSRIILVLLLRKDKPQHMLHNLYTIPDQFYRYHLLKLPQRDIRLYKFHMQYNRQ